MSYDTPRVIVLLFAAVLSCSAHGQALRETVGRNLLIGCAVDGADLKNPKLADLVVKQFSCITPEYELMPEFMADESGGFTFKRGDAVVEFAEKHKIPVFGHMLIWHFVTRKWLFESPDGIPLSRDKALENLERYITGVVRHYRGRIKAWNVVNEAISDKEGEYLRDTPALRAIGEDYIAKAFQFAHTADSEAELYYNDYDVEKPAKLAKTLRLVKSLKAANVPIHAVGIQGHWLMNWPPTDMIEKGIDALAAAGVRVMITELDIDPLPRDTSGADMAVIEKGANPYVNGLPPEMQKKLAERYREVVASIVSRESVTMLGFWGTHDGRSWLNNYPVKGRTNHPLLFDRQFKSKPAYDSVLAALQKAKHTHN